MMYLIPDPVATTQLSGIAESSPARPSPSKSYQHGEKEKSSPCLVSYAKSPISSRRRYYSSDEDEDDSRDRQSHWKRIKTRPDDGPRGGGSTRTLIRYSESRDNERSPPRIRLQAPPRQSPSKPRPGHRVILLKGSDQRHGESEGRSGGSKGWGDGQVRDGGTASKGMDLGVKRKQDLISAFGNVSHRSLMMSERSMVVREKLTARRAPVERGYEVRVSGREVGEFVYGDDEEHDHSLSVEDAVEDDYVARARIGSDLREFLNRRGSRASEEEDEEVEVEAMSKDIISGRGYGDYRIERFCSDVGWRVRCAEFDATVGSGKVQGSVVRRGLDWDRGYRAGNDDSGKERVASVRAKSARDMELGRRQEKRERWAEKERDLEKELEKENMPKSTLPPPKEKPVVTVVDYSHKFTLAKAPISAPTKLVEGDPHRLCQRQKQIDYGKNTLGYERYTDMIPRYQRTKAHPRTPDIRQVCSKRSWDGQIRKWRRLLHEFDPPKGEDEEDPDQMLAPRRQQEICATDHDGLMDMQLEDGEHPDMKIYEGWSDDEC